MSESSPGGEPKKANQPGYDNAFRWSMQQDLRGTCQLLGIEPEHDPRLLSTTFPRAPRTADLVFEAGPEMLVHVEYQTKVEPELLGRLLLYRGLIMLENPGKRVTQHVVVINRGRVEGYDDLDKHGFALKLNLIYMWETEPKVFLDIPTLRSLAVLAGRGEPIHAQALGQAARLIQEEGNEERKREMLGLAFEMATLRLNMSTIDKTLKEAGVSAETVRRLYEQSEFGREFLKEADAKMDARLKESSAKSHAEGHAEGLAEVYRSLLQLRFGEDPTIPSAVERLLTRSDVGSVVRAINAAVTPADLAETADEPSAGGA